MNPKQPNDRKAQDGILIGNQIDKAQVTNPIARRMVAGFDSALDRLLDAIDPKPASVHEVGCGEGRVSRRLHAKLAIPVRASDFSSALTEENIARREPGVHYVMRSIYDLNPAEDGADLVLCCEVLEHLERPSQALAALRRLAARDYIISVPCEPLWRGLNMARGKYLSAFGNTPGHLNHWSRRGFVDFLESGGFTIKCCLRPLPWTMVRGSFA